MKIGILGAYGFLGTHLTTYYTELGNEVLKFGKGDTSLASLKECDLLIHSAAINRAPTSEEVIQGNLNITKDLIQELKLNNVKIPIKYISSIQEGNATPYGIAKLESKKLLDQYCATSRTLFESYKLPNLFGTKGKPNYNSFVNTFAYNIVHNIECTYNSNPIDLCHVSDAIKVIDNKTPNYKVYTTTVKEVYNKLNNPDNSEFDNKLTQILNYYKSL